MVTDSVPVPGYAYRIYHVVMILVVAAAVVVSGVAIGAGVRDRLRGDTRVSSVHLLSDNSAISGATSLVMRRDDGVDYSITTSGLPVGHIVTLKALIFNKPGKCKERVNGRRCGEADLANPEAGGSLVFLRGLYYRQAAPTIRLEGRLAANDAAPAVSGDGLTNPGGAAIELVLLDHGPPVPSLFGEMLTTIGAGCSNAPSGAGTPGTYACTDLQISAHE